MANLKITRVKTLKDLDVLDSLLKVHIKENPCKSQLLWKGKDHDNVVQAYSGFLKACAETGRKLDKNPNGPLVKALQKVWEGSKADLADFAWQLADALSCCIRKGYGMSSGSKTHVAVLQVLKAFPEASPSEKNAKEPSPSPRTQSDSSDCEVITGFAKPEDETEALKCLHAAQGMFPCSLQRHGSTVSVASSEAASSKAPAKDDTQRKAEVL